MWHCIRYLSLVSALPAADDRQLFPCVEKQSIVLLNSNVSKTRLSQLKEGLAV